LPFVIWITGFPSSGKTTIAKNLIKRIDACHIDGDIIRKGINRDLGFSLEDREENIRRVSELIKILNYNNINVVATFVSPTIKIRNVARKILRDKVILIHLECSLKECIRRDVKGMYKKAIAREIKDFTGISSPYETPLMPDLRVNTELNSIEHCVNYIMEFLRRKGYA